MPREGDLNNPVTPTPITPPVIWTSRKVTVKETSQDLLWYILSSGFPYFVVASDHGAQIKLNGFGGALFNKVDFNLLP